MTIPILEIWTNDDCDTTLLSRMPYRSAGENPTWRHYLLINYLFIHLTFCHPLPTIYMEIQYKSNSHVPNYLSEMHFPSGQIPQKMAILNLPIKQKKSNHSFFNHRFWFQGWCWWRYWKSSPIKTPHTRSPDSVTNIRLDIAAVYYWVTPYVLSN